MPLINRPNEIIKLFRLVRIKHLTDARPRFLMECLDGGIKLLLEILHLLRGAIEYFPNLLSLGVGKAQFLLQVGYGAIFVKAVRVLDAPCVP
jgi:hypothetical protein